MKKLKLSRTWFKRLAMFVAVIGIGLSSTVFLLNRASAVAQGDGLLFYGASSNTNPQARTYTGSTNTFGSAGGTVSGTQALTTVMKTSPTKYEAVAGYVDNSGSLQIMCYDGISWSNEWTATVGGTGTTRRFDIAYERNSGDVIVLYGNNGADLGYRTKAGSSGCGSGNWASASTFTPARTTGTIQWVKLASDARSSSNLIAGVWADSNTTGTTGGDVSSQIWSGSAWGNEPSAALSTDLEFASAAQDVDSFDIEYETSSGDLMVVWGTRGSGATGLIGYRECTGGTSGCTWGTAGTLPSAADAATNLDLAADPNGNQMSVAAIDNGGGANSCDMSAGLWSGTAWTTSANFANVDTTAECPTAGQKVVSSFWLTSGSATRWVILYDDSAGTNIDWFSFNGTTRTTQTDFTVSPSFNDVRAWYASSVNPFDISQAIVTITDSTGALYAKRISMDGTGSLGTSNWSASDGSASLGTLSQTTVGDFSFAYWQHVPAPTYDQTAYRWYANADSVTPGSSLANENTAHTLTSLASPIRLRTQLTVGADPLLAATQAFRLQYSTSTSGPWKEVGAPASDSWCNDTSGVTCTTSWGARRKITLNNSASAANLADFPLLVKVNSSRIDYGKTQSAGQDIRFVDPSDPNTVLPYEIELWNESGDSYVWVKVPQIDSGSTTDYIWMYYDNGSASDGQAATSVWDSNYKVVQHLEETGACSVTFTDSTSTGNNGACTGSGPAAYSSGKIDGARDFDGSDDYINIADSASQDMSNGTYEAWFNTDTTGAYQWLLEKGEEDDDNYAMFINNSNRFSFNYRDTSFANHPLSDATTTIASGTWYHVVAVVDVTGNTIKLYINGAQVASTTGTGTPMTSTSGGIHIGAEIFGGGVSVPLNGKMDEVRVSNIARSADWLEADHISQNDAMNTFGSEETQADVGPAAVWDFYNNATPADGADVTTSYLLTGSNVRGTYQESSPTPVNPYAATIGQKLEWDFSLDPTDTVDATTYYFRMIKSSGSAISTYTQYPQITISLGSGPTLDQQMRGGQSVVNGVKQPFSF
jgi:hypothetical protein